MCEIYTTHPGKCPGKCPGKPITGGHGAFTLHHCASFTTTMVTRGRGGGDGRGRGYVGGGNEINNDSVEQSRWKIFATYG